MVSSSRLLMLGVLCAMMFATVMAGGGAGFGGFGAAKGGAGLGLLLSQVQQPVLQQQAWVQPVQPVVRRVVQPVLQQQKQINYAQPIVTYAQPIVQGVRQQQRQQHAPSSMSRAMAEAGVTSSERLDTTAPKMPDLSYTAQAIVQPTFQTAPVQNVQAITATAPTINKGYGSGLGLGQFGGYGAQGGLSARYGGF